MKRLCTECGHHRDEFKPVVKRRDGVVRWCCRQCWRLLCYADYMGKVSPQ
jgi:hypothetical protein